MCEKWKISKTTAIAIVVGVIILALWAGSWWWINQHFQKHDERGTFGDMFGAVNALFSGLAFAGLIITLFYQKEELKLQREELAQTREELKGQKKEFEIQNKTLKQQQFSTTFFHLLNAVQINIDNIEITRKDDHKSKGISCFRLFVVELGRAINYYIHKNQKNVPQKEAEEIYKNLYEDCFYPMGVFFRSYYRLIKFVITSSLEPNEKYQYISFARAQLSDDMIAILFYNLTIGYGTEKFKKIAEDWVLLNNMSSEYFIFDEMKKWISEDAFKRGNRYGKVEEMEKMYIK